MSTEQESIDSLGRLRRQLPRAEFLARFPHPYLVQRVEIADPDELPAAAGSHQTVAIATDLKHLRVGAANRAAHPIAKRSHAPVEGPVILGRDPDCDIVVDLGAISRRHALFVVGPLGRTTITDAGSSYGTRVNGRRLAEREALSLEDCAVISFADAVEFNYYSAIGLYTILGLLGLSSP